MKKMMIRVLPLLLVVCMLFSACTQKDCGHKNTEIQNAKAASCSAEGYTGDTVCLDCGAVVTAGTVAPLAAHAWGEWTVTKPATPITTGQQTRTCSVCAATEQAEIPAGGFNIEWEGFTGTWGSIDLGEIDSYQELAETVFETLFDFKNGTITFDFVGGGQTVALNATINAKGDSYVALLEVELTKGEGQKDGITVAYDNGVMVAYDESGAEFIDLDAIGDMPYSDFYLSLSKTFKELDAFAVTYLAEYKNQMQTFIDANGELYNKVMAQMGSTATADDLLGGIDVLQSLYVNMIGLLGFKSELEAKVEVAAPSAQDMFKLLSVITTVTEANGGKVYTLDASKVLESVSATLDEMKGYCDLTYGEFAYTVIAPFVTNPEITDWAKLEAYIRANVTGDTKCSVFIDKLISAAEAQGVSIDDYYALIDVYVEMIMGEKINSKEALMEFYDVTLNELIAMMSGSNEMTLEALYDQIFPMMNEGLIGEIPVEGDVTVAGAIDMVKEGIAKIAINALGFSITTDAQGNVIGIVTEADIAMDSAPVVDFKLEIKQDESAKVVLPEAIAKGLATKINAAYDANGNLVINGLDASLEYDFKLNTWLNVEFDLADVVVKDETYTADFGFDVYVLKEAYRDMDAPLKYSAYALVGNTYVMLEEVRDEGNFEEVQLPTMKLPSGETMYIKGTDGDYTYGYVAVSDELCVWAAYNAATNEEIYCGEVSNVWIDLEDVCDLSKALTKNADGTYVISADFFKELNQYLEDDYDDSYYIEIDVSYDVDGMDFYAWYEVGAHHGGEVPMFGFGASEGEATPIKNQLPWYDWFYN